MHPKKMSRQNHIPKMIQINPATSEKIGEVEYTDLSKMKQLMTKARQAQKIWGEKSFRERAKHVEKMKQYLFQQRDRVSRVISQCSGKTQCGALCNEVFAGLLACGWYAQNAKYYLAPKKIPLGTLLMVNKYNVRHQQPIGVVGIISPWNYPFSIPFGEIIMGLMAGNAILLKVSSFSVVIGELIKEIVLHGELPDGLFQHVVAGGSDVLHSFLSHGVNKIFFTGSVKVGKIIMEKAAKFLTPVSLELGGNDPMIVCEDADLDRAVDAAIWGGTVNCGQSCAGVERIYVHAKIYEKFVEKIAKKVKSMKHGVPTDNHDVDVGCMTTRSQLEIVRAQLIDAKNKGARVVAKSVPKGNISKGFFHPVVVLVNVNHNMDTMKSETFGPLLPIMKFNSFEEAVKLANDSDLALTASVFTNSVLRARKYAKAIDGGVVTMNDHLFSHGSSECEWGGWKTSGIGRTHGEQGLKEMCNAKIISYDLMPNCINKKNLWWHDFDKKSYETVSNYGCGFAASNWSFVKAYYFARLGPGMVGKMGSKGLKVGITIGAGFGAAALVGGIGFLIYKKFFEK